MIPSRAGRIALHVIAWFCRLAVAGLFIYAAVLKIGDPTAFAKDIRGYELFPEVATNTLAYLLPWLELSTALLLVVGYWRREARLLILAMLVAFTALKVVALGMGHDLNCGCFGETFLSRISVGWWGVWLNIGLLAGLAAELLIEREQRRWLLRSVVAEHGPARLGAAPSGGGNEAPERSVATAT